MQAVILTPLKIELREVTDLHKTLGGWLESLSVGEDFTVFIDEDGKSKGLFPNHLATAIICQMLAKVGRLLLPGDIIVGTAIFVGLHNGDAIDLPQAVIDEYFVKILTPEL